MFTFIFLLLFVLALIGLSRGNAKRPGYFRPRLSKELLESDPPKMPPLPPLRKDKVDFLFERD